MDKLTNEERMERDRELNVARQNNAIREPNKLMGDGLVNTDARKAAFEQYYEEHCAKNASAYEALLLAYDDVKMDVKNGRLE